MNTFVDQLYLFEYDGFRRVSRDECHKFIIPRHYAGRTFNVVHAFGYFQNGVMTACISFGIPASPTLCTGVCGDDYRYKVIEINRIVRVDECKICVSQLISYAMKTLKREGYEYIVVSYSDTGVGHNGYVYQASNFIYTGTTKERTDMDCDDKGLRHSRHATSTSGFRQVRSAKNRYVYFLGCKRFVKDARNHLKYDIQPYPKSESKRYELGDYHKVEIIKTNKDESSEVK